MTTRYEKQKLKQDFAYIIGCDEVGRGCLAGPVVAAAVLLKPHIWTLKRRPAQLSQVKDSKILSSELRTKLSCAIKENCFWSIGVVDEKKIDSINIHHASLLAMRKAVDGLLKNVSCESEKVFISIDGKFRIPSIPYKQEAVIDGDVKIFSIAAASIIAKVYRDALMTDFDSVHPGYDFSSHKGYATFHHRKMVSKLGISPIHRKSFCSNYM